MRGEFRGRWRRDRRHGVVDGRTLDLQPERLTESSRGRRPRLASLSMTPTLKGSKLGVEICEPFRVAMALGYSSGGGAALCPRLLPTSLSGSGMCGHPYGIVTLLALRN